MDIVEATRSYERWLAGHTAIIRADLARKHAIMADRASAFPFLRATFYRWTQRFPKVCPDLAKAPAVLGVGDLHTENFGTWRDAEGRLVWGVNDFDEACIVPYTSDLVRLAASLVLAVRDEGLAIPARRACQAVLDGYAQGVQAVRRGEARPFLLGQDHQWLTELSQDRRAREFWARLRSQLGRPSRSSVPRGAARVLEAARPSRCGQWRVYARVAGVGSLGRPRLCGVGDLNGGPVAREAKALVPTAMAWRMGTRGHARTTYRKIVSGAVRSPDPYLTVAPDWVVRRLAPDSRRVELAAARRHGDLDHLCAAMGRETANVHAGSIRSLGRVQADLGRRAAVWLFKAAEAAVADVRADWTDWRRAQRKR